ncbi:immunoglobulin-like domain-containing protein [uncultured Lacinutrix sp.]|uniref:immunoglobulin-like domain-containing protein n=1 Tax=uncultured Lacinutrix sp. TaxID=574032 RepID=UPI0026028945|nr:immunoglobulin-like domain-containing protein [uncultured Lacinutrix sp.]
MKQVIKKTKIFALLVLAIAFLGCEDDDVILPVVEAGFTHTINQTTGVVTFINTSTNADIYSWSFGDDNTSNLINPVKAYPSGTYTIVLEAKNVSGASDTFEDIITIAIPEAITLPITFDNDLVVYEATTFNGVAFEVVDNPDLSGTNTVASSVGKITNSGAAFEGFFFELGAPLDLSTDKSIKMNFWADVPVDVLLKLEQGSGADTETTASHGGTGWEEIIFTLDSAAEYSQLTMFVDGPGTTVGTFYVDDIIQVATVDLTVPVITLNGGATVSVILGTTFTDPGATASDNIDGDISANIVVGGDTVDVNTIGSYMITYDVSDAAGNAATQVIRTVEVITAPTAPTTSAPVPPVRAAADVISIYGESYTNIAVDNFDPNWGQSGHMQVNTTYDPGDGNLALAYPNFNYQGTDFSSNAQDASAMEFLHIDIWTPADPMATDIQVSPINNGTGAGETLVSIAYTTGTWTSLDIPIADFTGMTWDSVFQMKFAANGPGSTVPVDIYLDNIYFYKAPSGGGGTGSALLDFEDSVPFTGTFDGGANGSIVSNPDATGINTSANVYQFNKVMGSAWYSGAFHIFSQDIDPTAGNTFKVKMWSPNANINVRFQLEKEGNQGPIVTYQIDQNLAQANTWVELTFDFSTTPLNLADGYDKIVIFPDYDESNMVPVNPEAIYYIDDVIQE